MLGLVLISLLGAPAVLAETPAEVAATATLEQESLPGLEARRLAAEARSAAALDWFAGDGPWRGAWPEWSHRTLVDPAVLVVLGADVEAGIAARAAERVSPPPADLRPQQAARHQEALARTCEAEDARDALALRFLGGLAAGLAAWPELADDALGAWIRSRQQAATSARELLATSPDDEDAQRRVAAASELEAAHGALAEALIARWTVPGSDALDTWATTTAEAGLDAPRLWVPVLPLLSEARAEEATGLLSVRATRELAAERARIEARIAELTALLAHPPEPDTQDLDELEARAARARSTLELAEDPEAATPSLETQAARLEWDLAEAVLARAREQAAGQAQSHAEATLRADEARKAAEDAQARAEAAGATGRDATLERRLSTLRDQVALTRSTALVAHEQAQAAREALSQRLQVLRAQSAAARALPPLAPERPGSLDAAYREARGLVAAVRVEVGNRQDALLVWRGAARRQRADLEDFRAVDPGPGLAGEWQHGAAGLEQALEDRHQRELADLERALDLLARSRAERASLERLASHSARDEAARELLPELQQEVREVPIHLAALLRRGTGAWGYATEAASDLGAVQSFLANLTGVLVVLGLWVLVRPRVPRLLATAFQEARASVGHRVRSDLADLVPVATPVAVTAGDVLVLAVVLGALGDRWALLRLVVWLLLARRLVQLAPEVAHLAVATPHQSRPALTITTPEVRDLWALTARWVTLWLTALAVLGVAVGEVLQAVRLDEVVRSGGTLAGALVALALLWRWEPAIAAQVRATPEPVAFGAWLARQDGGATLRLFRGSLGGLWLAGRWLARLLDSRERTSWIGSLLARRHLREADSEVHLPLPATALDQVRSAKAPLSGREGDLARLAEQFAAWQSDHDQGLGAGHGDRGSGKGHFLRDVAEHLPGAPPVRRLTPPETHLTGQEAVAWLTRACGGTAASEIRPAIESLKVLPPTVFLLDDLQRLLLRRVGGFQSLYDVLVVMRETGGRHFWVVTCHGPTWNFLHGVRDRIPLSVFRATLRLEPVRPESLCAWLEERTRAAGLEPSYGSLSQAGTLGSDPALAIQRATVAYWRLLADFAEGNPEVAEALWLESLRRGRQPGTASIVLPVLPSTEQIDDLTATDLFVLAALITHDGLPTQALIEVLNLSVDRVRSACRHLLAEGVLTVARAGAPLYVKPLWRPPIHRLLRQKHVLRGRI